MMADETVSLSRVAFAALLASFSAVLAGTLPWFEPGDNWAQGLQFFALIVGIGTVLIACYVAVIALPLYAALRTRWPHTWWRSALAGFVLGVVPYALLNASPGYEELQLGDTVMIRAGHYTEAGWNRMLWNGFETGLDGALGGLVFWIVARPRRPKQKGGPLPDRPFGCSM